MDKHEMQRRALERIKVWLSTIFPFPNDSGYRPSWLQRKEMLFDIFKDTYPHLSGDTIRGRLEETWRKDHSDAQWQEVCDEILAAWDEWRYAWDNYPVPRQDY